MKKRLNILPILKMPNKYRELKDIKHSVLEIIVNRDLVEYIKQKRIVSPEELMKKFSLSDRLTLLESVVHISFPIVVVYDSENDNFVYFSDFMLNEISGFIQKEGRVSKSLLCKNVNQYLSFPNNETERIE